MLETKAALPFMKKLLLLLFATLLLASCYTTHDKSQVPKPDDLIVRDTLIHLLAEIELIESAIRDKQNLGHEIDDLNEAFYATVFKKYNVSREQFNRSMDYYKQNLEEMDDIYEDVISRLSVIESQIQNE
jgi:hypothetical protein